MNEFSVTSPAFEHGSPIPKKFTGDGEDASPALAWSGLPGAAKSIALICDDPDAPQADPWVHWVIFNIPATAKGLPEGVDRSVMPKAVAGAAQGHNSWGKAGWNGPSPPKGHGTHHYHFKVYALNAPLTLAPDVSKKQLVAAMQGHIVGQAELIGTYERK